MKNSWKCWGFAHFSCWQLWFPEKNCKVLSKLNFWTKIWLFELCVSEASFHLLALKLLEYLSRLPKCFSLIGKKRKTWQSTVQYRQLSLLLSYISFFFVLKNQFSTFSIFQMRQFCWYFKHCEIIKKLIETKTKQAWKKFLCVFWHTVNSSN